MSKKTEPETYEQDIIRTMIEAENNLFISEAYIKRSLKDVVPKTRMEDAVRIVKDLIEEHLNTFKILLRSADE